MPETKNSIGYNLKWFTLAIITLAIIFGGIFWYTTSLRKQEQAQIQVNIDKTVIVQKVQKLSKLETIDQTMQRDIQIEINSGDLKFFDVTLLQNKRTQKVAATGTVTAGVDLNKLSSDNIKVVNNEVTVDLPAPEIFNVNIIEDKTTILKDDLTLLFRLQDILNNSKRVELNDILQQQVIKQIKNGLVDAACQDNILDKAGENSKSTISDLLKNSGYKTVTVNYTAPQNCNL